MNISELLSKGFHRNRRIVEAQADGIDHPASLATSEHNINCLNWVVGHMLDSRENLIELLGGEGVLEEAERERYQSESDPIREEGPGVVRFERLLEALVEGQDRLRSLLDEVTDADLAAESTVGDRTVRLIDRVHFYYFHDTLHAGEAGASRQLSGVSDKVI